MTCRDTSVETAGLAEGRAGGLADESGQAVVEAAIVLPAVIFLVLTILQLTMVQHARIMTEYAAFCAARAGIVYNADGRAMRRAAELALLPTMTRTDTFTEVGKAVVKLEVEKVERTVRRVPFVQGRTLSPLPGDLTPALTKHLGSEEVDFDDLRAAASKANLLQIELQYNYEMRIPFANRILQAMHFASRANQLNRFGGYNMLKPTVELGTVDTGVDATTAGLAVGAAREGAVGVNALAGKHYFPLKATYTMRMQSNVFPKNIQNASW
jgi:hypothetical protein